MTPFSETYDENKERRFIEQARSGSREAAGHLVQLHQRFIYNVVLKLIGNVNDAQDMTQEILMTMLTKLGQFEFKGSFRTWLYRIATNHFLMSKRKKSELTMISFDELGDVLDKLYDDQSMSAEEQRQHSDQIIAFRNKCTASMLLCLDRQQRMVLILGTVFNLKSPVAAQMLNMTAENFRKQLSRAKTDLFQFMDDKCGLINPANPCKCYKKTKGFIKDGLIDPQTKQFSAEAVTRISEIAPKKNKQLDELMERKYLTFYEEQIYEKIDDERTFIANILAEPEIRKLFSLN
ncbi:RNA polymerase sigma factor [Mucilaginibacter sp. cycad4]|uniref:RNA polymerase sigma factor n=1 Tax=Mucilaginibacter sp. cycad4 TaxID=3342096 RepID=UPI002AAA89D8|nr:RNA polymerase sigma factor [Mucilaginibacter gossypii]WPU99159.1 RNA polymerase sigma factor [Mucilaginibacter gossypii]